MSRSGAAIGSFVTVRTWLDQRVESDEFSGVALVWRDAAPVFGSYAPWLNQSSPVVVPNDDGAAPFSTSQFQLPSGSRSPRSRSIRAGA